MQDLAASVLLNQREYRSNPHAEIIKTIKIEGAGYESIMYAPQKPSDKKMSKPATTYVLQIAAAIRIENEKSRKLQNLINTESNLLRKEEFVGILDTLELQIGALVSLYFLELHMEFPDWKGAPLFTLRDKNTVVVTQSSIQRLHARRGRPYNQSEQASIFRRLALSPIAPKRLHE